ncbi:MAG: universal stress protein [Candidatus Latescibacteria bacterium]|jgi:nucleotide-binding universal stress UspA family protein|nr:universal stress protein [Candidatus Latescibacterota bacterium]
MTQSTERATTERISLKHIIVPTDFSPLGNYAIEMAIEYAKRYDSDILLMHVMAPYFGGTEADVMAIPSAYYSRDMMAMLAERLEEIAVTIREKGVDVETHLTMGVPFVEVVKLARSKDTDLIVVSTHGRTGLSHAFLGSTAERIVRKAPCPVLTVRPPEPAT